LAFKPIYAKIKNEHMNFNKIREKIKTALIWSQKYTRIDMLYFAKGSFWLTSNQIIGALINFVLSVFIAHNLPKETYGLYKFILSVIGVIAIITLQGMSTAITQAVITGTTKKDILFCFWKKNQYGIIGTVVSILLSAYYYYQGDNLLFTCFLISSFFIPLFYSSTIYVNILNGKNEFKKLNYYQTISKIVYLLAMIITITQTTNILTLLIVYFTVITLTNLIILKFTFKKIKNDPNPEITSNLTTGKSIVKYGKNLSVINALETISEQFDKILIFHYLGAKEVAIFLFAVIPPEIMKDMLRSLQIMVFTKFLNSDKKNWQAKILPSILKLIFIIIPLIIIYIIISPIIYKLFFPNYLESIAYSQIYSLILITSATIIPYSVLYAKKSQKKILHLSITSSIIQISAIVLLSPLGIIGIMTGKLLAGIFNLVLATIISLKETTKKSLETTNL